jgi:hypothetical protein
VLLFSRLWRVSLLEISNAGTSLIFSSACKPPFVFRKLTPKRRASSFIL